MTSVPAILYFFFARFFVDFTQSLAWYESHQVDMQRHASLLFDIATEKKIRYVKNTMEESRTDVNSRVTVGPSLSNSELELAPVTLAPGQH